MATIVSVDKIETKSSTYDPTSKSVRTRATKVAGMYEANVTVAGLVDLMAALEKANAPATASVRTVTTDGLLKQLTVEWDERFEEPETIVLAEGVTKAGHKFRVEADLDPVETPDA